MAHQRIAIKGAREHNLQSIDVELPKNALICLTGISGSGKSSLAFDTLYAEGERRYLQSLSTIARQYLGKLPRPDVDLVEGLSPPISISQKTSSYNPRSTVGTLTEIHDFLRLLYARVGRCYCPVCRQPIGNQSAEGMVSRLEQLPEGTQLRILAPVVRDQKGGHAGTLAKLRQAGFLRARIDGQWQTLSEIKELTRSDRHSIEVLVNELALSREHHKKLEESFQTALGLAGGLVVVLAVRPQDAQEESIFFSQYNYCPTCRVSFPPLTPQSFSFNHPDSVCSYCQGLGTVRTWLVERLITDPQAPIGSSIWLPPNVSRSALWHYLYNLSCAFGTYFKDLGADHLGHVPWQNLSELQQRIILYGKAVLPYQDLGFQASRFSGLAAAFDERVAQLRRKAERQQCESYKGHIPCPVCRGDRISPQAAAVCLRSSAARFQQDPEWSLPRLCRASIEDAVEFVSQLVLDPIEQRIAEDALREIRARLSFLIEVGLGYLSLDRPAPTLSGGEAQRIRLAGQIGSGLMGVVYVLDEPSIGLHARDNQRLLGALKRLRDLGNTVVVVEHDEETMRAADWIVDFGPEAGRRGGKVVAQGTIDDLANSPESLTGKFLSGKETIPVPARRREGNGKVLRVVGARHNNLKNITVDFPLGTFICVTGVSGSGKSSLVNDILIEALHKYLNKGDGNPGSFERLEGLEHLDKVIAIDQSPIGRTPRSNPGTYVKAFDEIRKFFTKLPEARRRGFAPGRFSFNVEGGRCEHCKGNGALCVPMDFLADVWITCPVCQGSRFNRETLQVRYKEHSIADVLRLDVREAHELFEQLPAVCNKLNTLRRIGLDYIQLGQPSPTLSGGEAQRIKLARELSKRSTGKTVYILDEPTTGLHFADVRRLLDVLHAFVDAGNTVIVVEHNMDVVKTADWIIDLGPEGGQEGGYLVAAGTPEQIAQQEQSHTGRALRRVLSGEAFTAPRDRSMESTTGADCRQVEIRGATQNNLRKIDLTIPRDAITVFCGPSGSGKTSLAIDTLYAEGQRRYVESLSPYARQFVSQMPKPHVERVQGLSPAIALEAKGLGHNPRSTVGTVTEIYDYLRVLFARLGQPYCPSCQQPVGAQTVDEIVDQILGEPEGTPLLILAPLQTDDSTHYPAMWEELQAEGFRRVRIDGQTYAIEEVPQLKAHTKHCVEVVVDRWQVRHSQRSRLAQSVELALSLADGVVRVAYPESDLPETKWRVRAHSTHTGCRSCGRSFEPLEPNHFSFNSRFGWCPACRGLGVLQACDPKRVLKSPKLSLAEGLLWLWPDLSRPLSRAMLKALCDGTGLPPDVPYHKLSAEHRRLLWFGTGDRWFEVAAGQDGAKLRFRFRGIQGAVERASSASPNLASQVKRWMRQQKCLVCNGGRVREEAAAVRFQGRTIVELCQMPLAELYQAVQQWQLPAEQQRVGGELIREIRSRLQFLLDVQLDYLTLHRRTATLSHGEAQRIRLASQLGSGLSGVLYVLDEPTVGLHPQDNRQLIGALKKLRDQGNTLVVVEHDREVIREADHVVEFGPGAGQLGGRVVAQGKPEQLAAAAESLTAPFLTGAACTAYSKNRLRVVGPTRPGEQPCIPLGDVEHASWLGPCPSLVIHKARRRNLKEITVEIPLKSLVCITGPSGSGKSTLLYDVLREEIERAQYEEPPRRRNCDRVSGVQHISRVICVDQSPIGSSPHSTPATYTQVYADIRKLFSKAAREADNPLAFSHFTYSATNGVCRDCKGLGQVRVEMHFLPDVWVPCRTCQGKRFHSDILQVLYRGKSITDVLNMTCEEARDLFADVPSVHRVLALLCDLGLGYLVLGQSSTTLSGGEAQRLKLATELARRTRQPALYLLDEPTTGLHFRDIERLVVVLQRLVDEGHTVVVIEHNLDLIQAADWIIDLGPGAGKQGGHLVAAGPLEHLVQWADKARADGRYFRTATGEALRDFFKSHGQELPRAIHRDEAESEGLLRAVVRTIEQVVSCVQPAWQATESVELRGNGHSDWFCRVKKVDAESVVLQLRVSPAKAEPQAVGEPALSSTGRSPAGGGVQWRRVKTGSRREQCDILEARLRSVEQLESDEFLGVLRSVAEVYQEQDRPNSTGFARELPGLSQTPWKVLKRSWHESRQGFSSPPKRPQRIIRFLLEFLSSLADPEEFVWEYPDRVELRDALNESWLWLSTKDSTQVILRVRTGHSEKLLSALRFGSSEPGGIIQWSWKTWNQFVKALVELTAIVTACHYERRRVGEARDHDRK